MEVLANRYEVQFVSTNCIEDIIVVREKENLEMLIADNLPARRNRIYILGRFKEMSA